MLKNDIVNKEFKIIEDSEDGFTTIEKYLENRRERIVAAIASCKNISEVDLFMKIYGVNRSTRRIVLKIMENALSKSLKKNVSVLSVLSSESKHKIADDLVRTRFIIGDPKEKLKEYISKNEK